MNSTRNGFRLTLVAFGTLLTSLAQAGQTEPQPAHKADNSAQIESGQAEFQQRCAFCHGRDAGGGETGPDLTSSKLVAQDVAASKIGPVIRNGRTDKGMPPFNLPETEIAALAAFVHSQAKKAASQQGGRRGVDVADLQTGHVEEGKRYFNGPGGCSACHSPSGDLAAVATRYQGLKLEERLLYPEGAKAKATVILPSGQTIAGQLNYRDEFTIGLIDDKGWYRSWSLNEVKYAVDNPVQAHVDLLAKYTDDDIHNLMAYLQTLR